MARPRKSAWWQVRRSVAAVSAKASAEKARDANGFLVPQVESHWNPLVALYIGFVLGCFYWYQHKYQHNEMLYLCAVMNDAAKGASFLDRAFIEQKV